MSDDKPARELSPADVRIALMALTMDELRDVGFEARLVPQEEQKATTDMSAKLRIDPEFRGFISPMSDAEREALRKSLIETGRAINPLVTWNGTILDGHNRYEICTELGLPYDTIEVSGITDRASAKRWMFDHQVARRNLSRDQIVALALLRGVPIKLAGQQEKNAGGVADTADGKERLEYVLAGKLTLLQMLNLSKNFTKAPMRVTPRTRRGRPDIAMDLVRTMSEREFEAFGEAFMAYAEKRHG